MKTAPVLAAILVLAALASPAAPVRAAEKAEKRMLYVYTWEEYFSLTEVRAFERKYGCTVEFIYYDSNETMLMELSEHGGYDIITPPPSMARTLFDARRLRALDHSLLPNIGNIDADSPALAEDPTMRYSVPYTVTVTGIGYNRTMVSDAEAESWAIFADKRLAKRMTMMNDMRETIGVALKHLGYSINSIDPDEIAEAGRLVRGWKENLARFDVDSAREGLQNGELAAIQAYGGDMAPLMEENPDIGFRVPKEGSAFNTDVFVIDSESEEPELAHAFINHFLDAAVALNAMREIKFPMPNKPAWQSLDSETRESIGFDLIPGVQEKCEAIRNVSQAGIFYDRVWEKILFD